MHVKYVTLFRCFSSHLNASGVLGTDQMFLTESWTLSELPTREHDDIALSLGCRLLNTRAFNGEEQVSQETRLSGVSLRKHL